MEIFPFGEPSEEQKAALEEHRKHIEMHNEDYANSVHALFTEIDIEHLVTLNSMLYSIANSEGGRVLSAFYQGQTQMVLKIKHGVCPVHGINHEEEDLAELTREKDPSVEQPEPEDVSIDEDDMLFTREHIEEMERLNIEPFRNAETGLPQYRCKNCGLVYSSIDDRALVGKDGCKGCHEKSMWG